MRTHFLFSAILTVFLLLLPTVQAQTALTASHERVDLGNTSCGEPHFPKKTASKDGEGWVGFRFTVQPDGKLTDLEVVTKAGEESFVAAGRENLSKCRFSRPPTENGQPISMFNVFARFTFARPQENTKQEATEKIETSRQLLMQGRLAEAAASLDSAEQIAKRITDLNQIILLRASLMSKWGKDDVALRYLRQIPNPEKDVDDSADTAKLLRLRLSLELKLGLLASAEITGRTLTKIKPQPEDAVMLASLEKLRQFGATGAPMAVSGRVPAECRPMICDPAKPSWEYVPVHRTVSLADAKGRLDQVILRCTRRTVTIPATTDTTWTLPAKLGQCAVEVTGEPGATFTLIDETL
ncbi:energy transducer TonB [Niveispirillum sp. BGYR6]|uniref:energy transducer TonB n=1 Tax=Niveispirillum sp. BGYR6 TaxID=2971249 RepID=UPI0022B974DB|nr:energy transducer TonB [Niveispirillum sp. BGYR6]MDG5497731.1 energy transducer TonB [Niveispirillum sp. BGYR6]